MQRSTELLDRNEINDLTCCVSIPKRDIVSCTSLLNTFSRCLLASLSTHDSASPMTGKKYLVEPFLARNDRSRQCTGPPVSVMMKQYSSAVLGVPASSRVPHKRAYDSNAPFTSRSVSSLLRTASA